MAIISIREFARRAGVDRKTVLYRIKTGLLHVEPFIKYLQGIDEKEIDLLKSVVKRSPYVHKSKKGLRQAS